MRKLLVIASFSGALLLASGAASAHGGGWSVAVGPGGVGVSVGSPYYGTLSVGAPSAWVGAAQYAPYPPAVYPAPVYAPRVYAPPVYAAPAYAAPMVVAPAYAPPVVYRPAPVYAPPVVYRPAPVYVVPRWVGGHYVGGPRAGHRGGHHWR